MSSGLQEDPISLGLAAQARPGRTDRHGNLLLLGVGKYLPDLILIAGKNDYLGKHAVGTCIAREFDQINRPGEDLGFAEDGDQVVAEPPRCSFRQFIRRTIVSRRVLTWFDERRIGLK